MLIGITKISSNDIHQNNISQLWGLFIALIMVVLIWLLPLFFQNV